MSKMMVIRPANPKLAVDMARAISDMLKAGQITVAESVRRFESMIGDQDYTLVGYMSSDGKTIEDEHGNRLGDVHIGDSFVKMRGD